MKAAITYSVHPKATTQRPWVLIITHPVGNMNYRVGMRYVTKPTSRQQRQLTKLLRVSLRMRNLIN